MGVCYRGVAAMSGELKEVELLGGAALALVGLAPWTAWAAPGDGASPRVAAAGEGSARRSR